MIHIPATYQLTSIALLQHQDAGRFLPSREGYDLCRDDCYQTCMLTPNADSTTAHYPQEHYEEPDANAASAGKGQIQSASSASDEDLQVELGWLAALLDEDVGPAEYKAIFNAAVFGEDISSPLITPSLTESVLSAASGSESDTSDFDSVLSFVRFHPTDLSNETSPTFYSPLLADDVDDFSPRLEFLPSPTHHIDYDILKDLRDTSEIFSKTSGDS